MIIESLLLIREGWRQKSSMKRSAREAAGEINEKKSIKKKKIKDKDYK